MLYEGEGGTAWQQSTQAEPVLGAPVGFRRYQVLLQSNTFTSGPGVTNVSLIPYIQTVAGARLFDHNRISDPLGSYELTPLNSRTVQRRSVRLSRRAPCGDGCGRSRS